jgi:hypothetical protein
MSEFQTQVTGSDVEIAAGWRLWCGECENEELGLIHGDKLNEYRAFLFTKADFERRIKLGHWGDEPLLIKLDGRADPGECERSRLAVAAGFSAH